MCGVQTSCSADFGWLAGIAERRGWRLRRFGWLSEPKSGDQSEQHDLTGDSIETQLTSHRQIKWKGRASTIGNRSTIEQGVCCTGVKS